MPTSKYTRQRRVWTAAAAANQNVVNQNVVTAVSEVEQE